MVGGKKGVKNEKDSSGCFTWPSENSKGGSSELHTEESAGSVQKPADEFRSPGMHVVELP